MNDILKLNLDYVNTKSGLDIYDIFNSELETQKGIIQTIIDGKCSNMLGWKCLTTHQEEVVKDIEEYCKYAREKFEYFIVLGVGGSALGAKVIYNAMCSSVYNEQTREKRKAPKFFVLDNTDPCEINDVLSIVDLKSTLINVVSKSGTTICSSQLDCEICLVLFVGSMYSCVERDAGCTIYLYPILD